MNKNIEKKECIFCSKKISIQNYRIHKEKCFLNPEREILYCPVCNKVLTSKTTTCSRKCRYKYFGPGNKNGINGIDTEPSYRKVCFSYHPHYCIICNENKILAVHHFDENTENNNPENLIPLCLTHHAYIHSKYKKLIINKIELFILKYFKYMWE